MKLVNNNKSEKPDPIDLVSQMRYHIMKPASRSSMGRQHDVYDFWKTLWREVFSQVGRGDELNPDEFFRQDLIVAITTETDVVGFHLYTYFDLSWAPARDHSYFNGIDRTLFARLHAEGMDHVMAMEYLSVNPKFRRSVTGISFGEVIISLGFKLLPFTPCNAAIGTARTDVKVDESSIKLGSRPFHDPIKKYDYPCQLMVCSLAETRPHPDLATRQVIEQLWQNRNDETLITRENPRTLRIAG